MIFYFRNEEISRTGTRCSRTAPILIGYSFVLGNVIIFLYSILPTTSCACDCAESNLISNCFRIRVGCVIRVCVVRVFAVLGIIILL